MPWRARRAEQRGGAIRPRASVFLARRRPPNRPKGREKRKNKTKKEKKVATEVVPQRNNRKKKAIHRKKIQKRSNSRRLVYRLFSFFSFGILLKINAPKGAAETGVNTAQSRVCLCPVGAWRQNSRLAVVSLFFSPLFGSGLVHTSPPGAKSGRFRPGTTQPPRHPVSSAPTCIQPR
ncbi:hypothetical protein psal_cds_77 [Pandoravirus salinus]|uniref:Uncharacterized protein n=1 Tax=Pandoravirus salinus TaxID=1349410 RepID=A0A291ATG6_9VIRU|nr:hypothetical protein psal_cds_77 [Pandoravirus salinus]ATE82115.1 hypothetical protein psal_cds_77 [Pandoravirus salinus]